MLTRPAARGDVSSGPNEGAGRRSILTGEPAAGGGSHTGSLQGFCFLKGVLN